MAGKALSYDIVIAGGGLVGASLACALAGQSLRVAVIEPVPFSDSHQPSFDDRAVALAQGSQKIFQSMSVWDVASMEVTPIHRIHVSDRGRFGFVYLDRVDEGVPALGWVAPARALGQTLGAFLRTAENIDLISPAEVASVSVEPQSVDIDLADGRSLSSHLLVAADGARSGIREQLGVGVRESSYGQTAIITNVATQLPNDNVAWERFTESGPLAMLPMGERRCAVVFTVRNEDAEFYADCDDDELLSALQDRFGYRLGRLESIGRRVAYPLTLVRAQTPVHPRVALVGNAVHTLHPIAGQGFNLGLRDVAALAEVVVDARNAGTDVGSESVLKQYSEWRERDHRRVISLTDGMTRIFANPLPPVRAGRNAAMTLLNLCPPAKKAFGHFMMGRSGRLPRLARGLSL